MNYNLLVNKNNKMKSEYLNNFNLLSEYNELNENIKVEEETYKHFLKLKEYLKTIDINIGIDDSYRSIETQQLIQDEYQIKYGEEFTKKYVAVPGESEHHTGLAIDIMLYINGDFVREDDKLFFYEDVFKKIHEVLYKYGFILRYPENKEKETAFLNACHAERPPLWKSRPEGSRKTCENKYEGTYFCDKEN